MFRNYQYSSMPRDGYHMIGGVADFSLLHIIIAVLVIVNLVLLAVWLWRKITEK